MPSAFADGPKQTLGDLVRAGKRDSVIAAITSPDVNVNEQAPDGSTALMWATFNVDRELVRALLKAGAKADVTNHYGATALSEAVKVDDLDLVRTLLDAGANVNSPNLDKQTALLAAVSNGSLPISKLLIERGADVNAVETFRGQNALMWAAGGNQPDIVDLLLANGAKDVNLRAMADDWPRQMTSEPRAQFQSRQTGGLTPLLYATRSGCLRCARVAGEGRRRRRQAESGRRDAAHQRARQQALGHRDVPARQGREPAHLGHERPHADLRRGGREDLHAAQASSVAARATTRRAASSVARRPRSRPRPPRRSGRWT